MDFSMIRPKPPTIKPEPPRPEEEPPSSDPPPAAPEEPPPPPPPPPPQHQEMTYPSGYEPPRMAGMGPYMEEFYRSSHKHHRLRSIEYTNARTWRANFGGHSDDYCYDNPYKHGPSGHQKSRYMVEPPHSHDYMLPPPPSRLGLPPPNHHHHALPGTPPRLGLPPQDHHHALPGPPSRLGLPPPDHHHALPGPPPMFGLPPPDYHHGPAPPLSPYRHSQPYYDYFSDENPNGCTVM